MREWIKRLTAQGLRICILSCLLQSLPAVVFAGEVRDLYRADIAVQGQTRAERNKAIQTGLQQVLTRVTGRRDITDSDIVKQALACAAKDIPLSSRVIRIKGDIL